MKCCIRKIYSKSIIVYRFYLAFNISNYSIDRVEEATFLGVILDEHLTWKSHIHNVARKVSKAIGIIYKSSFCLNNSSLRMLYFSLIYTYLLYCVSVWASTYPSNLRKLITLQKRVVRIMSRSVFFLCFSSFCFFFLFVISFFFF